MSIQRAKVDRLTGLLGSKEDGELVIGDFRVTSLASQVGTPYYVYNGDAVVRKIQQVRQAMGPETSLYYSLKANPSLGLSQLIFRQGIGAEVASIGELVLAQQSGFPPCRIIFAGPGKTDEELELAARLGIQAVNVESPGEIERLAGIAAELGKTIHVGLRINPAASVRGAQMHMGGGAQQFGIDEEALPGVMDRFERYPNLQVVGLHVYTGTQAFDVAALLSHCHRVVDLSLKIANYMGRPLKMIDFGGGFGVPYFENSPEFDLQFFASGYSKVVNRCKGEPSLSSAQLIVELGRYLIAEAGVYVTRVVDVKCSRGKTFVVTDGGMNHHIMATGNFGQVFRKAYPIALLNRMDGLAEEVVTIVGPCCTPLDVIGRDIPFPTVNVGDLIGVFYSGAYGYSASSLAFLSHPTPAEVLICQGKAYLLRTKGSPDQVLQGQHQSSHELDCTYKRNLGA